MEKKRINYRGTYKLCFGISYFSVHKELFGIWDIEKKKIIEILINYVLEYLFSVHKNYLEFWVQLVFFIK